MLDGCVIWNLMLFTDERRFMNTGTSVAIYGDTLVFGTSFIAKRKGGYVTVYERKNKKWEFKNTFIGKDIAPGYQFPMYSVGQSFISVSDTVIGVASRYARIIGGDANYDKLVSVFAKQNGQWNYIDEICGEDREAYFRPGEGFASSISVYKNKILILDEGDGAYFYFMGEDFFLSEQIKKYIYKSSKASIISIENGKISQKEEFYIPFNPVDNVNAVQLLDKQILIASYGFKYIDKKNEENVTDGGISIYDYSNNSFKLNTIFNNKNNAYMEKPLSIKFAAIRGNDICIALSKKIYILRKNNDSWDLCANIDIPNDVFSKFKIVFDTNIVAIATNNYIYVYRCDYMGSWNLTDKITLSNLTKHSIYSVSLSIYDHTLVLGINNVDIKDETSDAIAYLLYIPFFFPKNPGKVCIIELLPDEGFKVEDKIIRYYTLNGKVRYKSEFN
jgi:hypothetical protein